MIRFPAVIVLVAASSVGAFAAEWPAKPVRLVVPFAAGGAADTMGRLHAEALTAAFGKQFYVENRVGGGGLVGTEAVARAEPDGLTLMVSGIPTHVLGPAMNKNVGFDPMHDFTHIAYFGGTPNVLVAHPSLGVTTYRDFLAFRTRWRRHRIRVGRFRHHGQLDCRISGGKGRDRAGGTARSASKSGGRGPQSS